MRRHWTNSSVRAGNFRIVCRDLMLPPPRAGCQRESRHFRKEVASLSETHQVGVRMPHSNFHRRGDCIFFAMPTPTRCHNFKRCQLRLDNWRSPMVPPNCEVDPWPNAMSLRQHFLRVLYIKFQAFSGKNYVVFFSRTWLNHIFFFHQGVFVTDPA